MDIIRIIFAILLPPVGVFLQVGLGLQFWVNILLTLLGYIPGRSHVAIHSHSSPRSWAR
ncbi:YqaE/Pmp3 family membrane protein [Kushneria aurantia]|uniref:YqaE/Pmp3 family membrane protein n=1 Tax=Kushneria aurantia TaxID=504092 RepID=A0ABV6G1Q6_9GAMM|nr:YqaE/Pmp3 family membrane protein [Kushneria aurantia]